MVSLPSLARRLGALLACLLSLLRLTQAWSPTQSTHLKLRPTLGRDKFEILHVLATHHVRAATKPAFSYSRRSTERHMLPAAASSILAGSVAGAIGVGVAFPFDTLKTKAQVMESEYKMTMTEMIQNVYKQEGIAGFFGGVQIMMLGQAVIKSVAFGSNAAMLAFLQGQFATAPAAVTLIAASCFAGFVTSFFATPFERVKVLMQASTGVYASELDCLRAVLRREGWQGLLVRGLGPTMAREIPSYGIYFFIYGFFMQTDVAAFLGQFAPLVFGALSGCASRLPVYPVDVVKTVVQNTEGDDIDAWQVVENLYQTGGIGAFFDGVTPKMVRAAINHAVTFYVFDLVQQSAWLGGSSTTVLG